MSFFDFWTEAIAIDLGTANTLIIHNDKVVVDSPSIVAIDQKSGKIIAVGKEANMMHGKTHKNIETVRPLKDGVIADFNASEQMIGQLIKSIPTLNKKFYSPALKMVICIPSGITEVEMRAVRESAERVNGKEVYLIHEPMAAAIGAGLPVEEASGNMVVDIGGGTSEIAILSLNGVVYSESVKIGGDKMDESITSWIRRNYGCVIGDSTAEKIKYTIGCATDDSEKLEMSITGRNLAEGIPETFTINSEQMFEAMKDPLYGIVRAIRNALELSPPELAADIAERGIVLTGGGALLRDLDKLISNSTGIPVIVAEDPLTCVARGGGQALEIMDKYNIDLLSSE